MDHIDQIKAYKLERDKENSKLHKSKQESLFASNTYSDNSKHEVVEASFTTKKVKPQVDQLTADKILPFYTAWSSIVSAIANDKDVSVLALRAMQLVEDILKENKLVNVTEEIKKRQKFLKKRYEYCDIKNKIA